MIDAMKLALVTTNPTIGDLQTNAQQIIKGIAKAEKAGADLIVFSELSICGYPPMDLLYEKTFIDACSQCAQDIGQKHSLTCTVILSTPMPPPTIVANSHKATNSLLVFDKGKQIARYDKRLLPSYDVFDEDRYFEPGTEPCVITIKGVRIGLAVCEDLWKGSDAGFADRYKRTTDPVADLAALGARVLISPSASPFVLGKRALHQNILIHHAKQHNLMVASINQFGSNDELVFDGTATVVNPHGQIIAHKGPFENGMLVVDLFDENTKPIAPAPSCDDADLFHALTLGVHDYVHKVGFERVLIGLSGGIDSALTAAIACNALGSDQVLGVALPGPYSSSHSVEDALALADSLNMQCLTIPVSPMFDASCTTLNQGLETIDEALLGTINPDIAEQNLQARLRGTTLMALSNRTGALLLTTGNKSELAVGYCTLYGDMNGGLAVLADVSKTWVFRLSRWINTHFDACNFVSPPIPQRTITKPPSAELAPDQKDSDSLPDYEVLDEIIQRHVQDHQNLEQIISETGFENAVVQRVLKLIRINEYKRRQAAIGLKVTSRAFGTGRRMPIARK